MSSVRSIQPGATRTCPHCRATVLERSLRCPQCQKHLRAGPSAGGTGSAPGPSVASPFRVEGTIHAPAGETWEYHVLVVVRDAQGKELSRHLVAVGAMAPLEARGFSLSVEVSPVETPGSR